MLGKKVFKNLRTLELSTKMVNSQKLDKDDFNVSCKDMALYLLGKLLVRKLDENTVLKARIVETECYLGGEDKASRSFGGKQTPGNAPMFMPAGTCFVYMTYGMYYCFNISTIEPGAAVLLRALEPIEGHETMQKFRTERQKVKKELKDTELCNGPSKLCMAMSIDKEQCNKLDITENDQLWIEDDGVNFDKEKIVTTSRIGIASAGAEWAKKPLRFYVLSNPHVSKRDKTAEKELNS